MQGVNDDVLITVLTETVADTKIYRSGLLLVFLFTFYLLDLFFSFCFLLPLPSSPCFSDFFLPSLGSFDAKDIQDYIKKQEGSVGPANVCSSFPRISSFLSLLFFLSSSTAPSPPLVIFPLASTPGRVIFNINVLYSVSCAPNKYIRQRKWLLMITYALPSSPSPSPSPLTSPHLSLHLSLLLSLPSFVNISTR